MTTPAQPDSRAELTRAWAAGIAATAYVPMCDQQIEVFLRELLDRLIDALGAAEYTPHPAAGVGARLVATGFTGPHSLGRTVEILTANLPANDEVRAVKGLVGKVASLLGELSSGYAIALRRRILDQQEDVKNALVRAIREGEARFREVFTSTPVGIAISQLDGHLIQTNDALSSILGHHPVVLTGRRVQDLFHPDDAASLTAAYQKLAGGHQSRFQTRATLLAANGDAIWASLAVSLLRDAEGIPTHHVTIVDNVTDVHLLEKQLRHQTLHDLLTGLANQEYFWIHLKTALEMARPEATITLCKIDLDGFSLVNDGHGHEAGNLVLRTVAGRLQRLVEGRKAMVARFGADEFAIVIEDSTNPPDLAILAKDINADLSEPVYLGDYGLAVSAGIGLARRPARGIAATELVRAADTALHRAKRIGRAQWALEDPPADAHERARYTLATAMPGAWENGQISLRYQPLYRLDPAAGDAGRIVAVQALLHWEHPERGVLTAEECVSLAEQTGLIVSIGPWMVRQACSALRGWRDQLGTTTPPLRVDLIAYLAQDPDLMTVLLDALDAGQLRPGDLQLGIPVGPIVAGCRDTEDNLHVLADLGVWIVLTQYSQSVGNLVTLENQPVRAVDITDPLVRISAQRPGSVVLQALSSLVSLVRHTGTGVVVGGVDTPEEADWWRSIGIDSARGAAFTAPRTPEEIPALLTDQ